MPHSSQGNELETREDCLALIADATSINVVSDSLLFMESLPNFDSISWNNNE